MCVLVWHFLSLCPLAWDFGMPNEATFLLPWKKSLRVLVKIVGFFYQKSSKMSKAEPGRPRLLVFIEPCKSQWNQGWFFQKSCPQAQAPENCSCGQQIPSILFPPITRTPLVTVPYRKFQAVLNFSTVFYSHDFVLKFVLTVDVCSDLLLVWID